MSIVMKYARDLIEGDVVHLNNERLIVVDTQFRYGMLEVNYRRAERSDVDSTHPIKSRLEPGQMVEVLGAG